MPRLTLGARKYTAANGTEREYVVLLLDGVEVEDELDFPGDYQGKITARLYEETLKKQIPDLRIRDVIESVHRLAVSPSEFHVEELNLITVVLEFEIYPMVEEGKLVFTTVVVLNWHDWNKPWSPSENIDEMKALAAEYPGVTNVHYGADSDEYQAIIEFPLGAPDRLLLDELEAKWHMTKRFVLAVEERLRAKLNENSLLNYFNFHPAVQGPCEEYLWSFVQFLKDVGVEATAELKQDQTDPSKVLFSVTPKRGKAVLGKIKQALDLYISLVGANQFEFDANASIQAERLESRVLFFQSQLKSAALEARLQEATIQAHEKAIQAQETALQKVDATNVFLLARVDELEREKEKKAKDEREFFGGIIRLGNWNTKGFIVNLPRLIDAVKVVMAEDEIISTSIKKELESALEMPALPAQEEDE